MLASDVIERAEKRVGQTLKEKWHLDRVIGIGGMAAVYEATHRNKNRVAIKILHPEMSLDSGTRSRFLREGYVANTIRHPGSVQVLDDDVTDDGAAFLVMELLSGESLEERMLRKGGRLDPEESLLLIDGLLDILVSAHEQGVVHRDIKPDNLFLTQQGSLKVLDFGIARLQESGGQATRVGSFMGTPAFCAPEQARGRWNEVDARTDLFSVGATLFTMLTGRHVHEAETSSEQLALAISSTPRSLRDLIPEAPAELVDLVDMSLAYDKDDRFQTARAMRAAVQRVIAGFPVGKKLSAPPEYAVDAGDSIRLPSRTLSTNARRALFAVVAVVIGGAFLALGHFLDTRTDEGARAAASPPSAPSTVPTTLGASAGRAPDGDASVAVSPSPPAVPSTVASASSGAPPKALPPSISPPTSRVVQPVSDPDPKPPVLPSATTSRPPSPSEEELFGKRY